MTSDKLVDLVRICSYAGERFDLVQAGGGNASWRNSDVMWIKASGVALGDVRTDKGLCELDGHALQAVLHELVNVKDDGATPSEEIEKQARAEILKATRSQGVQPSIETLLHSMLHPFTLHCHPPSVTALVCNKSRRESVKTLIPGALYVRYNTPGAILSLALYEEVRHAEISNRPIVAFLENHGLIVSAHTAEEVMRVTDEVVDITSAEAGLDLSHYKLTNQVTRLIQKVAPDCQCTYYSEDRVLYDLLKNDEKLLLARPAWPDQVVYCGARGLRITDLNDVEPVKHFIEENGQFPRVIVYGEHLLLAGKSLRNCKAQEDVLKAHVLTLAPSLIEDIQFLSRDEINFLLGWDAEKHRQNVGA